MTKPNLLIVIFGLLALVSVVQVVRLSTEVSSYKLKEAEQLVKHAETNIFLNDLQKASTSILNSAASRSFNDLVMGTLEFVHNNSLHKIDDEWKKDAFNIPLVIRKLVSASAGKEDDKPHLSCGPRAYAMRMILQQLGITSRLIGLSSDDFDTIQGHRLLEVYNQDRGIWETWDPDFGVTYVDKSTQKSVDIMQLVNGNLDNIIPMNRTTSGWKETKTQHLKDSYFEMALFESFTNGMTNSIIVINTTRFDTGKVFKDKLNVYQWARQNYGHPRIIELP